MEARPLAAFAKDVALSVIHMICAKEGEVALATEFCPALRQCLNRASPSPIHIGASAIRTPASTKANAATNGRSRSTSA